ncbi:hypothetical protein N9H70_08315 [Pseudomonadales bacterium]|jgi:hypothetical protein|nr:hypothetical protein [Pseudomonadales bacterium]
MSTSTTGQASTETLGPIIIPEKDAAQMLCLSVGFLQKDRSSYKTARRAWDAAGRKFKEPTPRIPFVQISDNRVGYRVATLYAVAAELEVGA